MNITLIGTTGAGKTTVGKAISEMSEFEFVDTDDVASERTVSEIHCKDVIMEIHCKDVIMESRKCFLNIMKNIADSIVMH